MSKETKDVKTTPAWVTGTAIAVIVGANIALPILTYKTGYKSGVLEMKAQYAKDGLINMFK